MDLATYLQNKGTLKSPVVQIESTSPLADPERPSHVANSEIANSLFRHLSRVLTSDGPDGQEAWLALTQRARGVRREQQAEARQPYATQPEAMSVEQTMKLVTATERRDALFVAIDAAVPVEGRQDARRDAELAALANAFRAKGDPAKQVWDGGDLAQSYGEAVKDLAASATKEAREVNVAIDELNVGADEDEKARRYDPREMTAGWLRSMPASSALGGVRWTENSIVVMRTNEEAAVVEGFLKIGLKAVDSGARPGREELAADVAALGRELSKPVVITKTEQTPGGTGLGKVGVRAVLVREPITSRAVDFRRGMSVPVGASPADAEAALRRKNGVVIGVEGQDWYAQPDVVAAGLKRVMKATKGGATLISHAPEGSAFRKTLEKAAAMAGLNVIHGTVELKRVASQAWSGDTRSHADGAYAVEARRSRDLQVKATIPDRDAPATAGVEGGAREEFGTGRSRYLAKKSIVIFDVVAKGPPGSIAEITVDNARTEHAALTPGRMLAFGVERHTKELPRILKRRELSGRTQAVVIDKKGKRVPPAIVASRIAQLGQTYAEKQRDLVEDTRGWRLDRPAGMLLATKAIGAERAASLAQFGTIGLALEASAKTVAAPKQAAKVAEAYRVDMDALIAANRLQRATRDVAGFKSMAASALVQVKAVREEDGTSLLVDPREPMVARGGPLVGFSADKARKAEAGSRVAIVGDVGDVSPALAANIDKVVANLATRYGRDEDGVARMKVMTTLSPGVGEAVIDAARKHRVPFEAVGHKDDRKFQRGTDDLRLFAKAWKGAEEGLGGTWSMHTYGEAERDRTLAGAAQMAMVGADAVLVARVASRDELVPAIAAVGASKPVMTLAASDPDPRAYSGNALLSTEGASAALTWQNRNGSPIRFTEGARVSEARDGHGHAVKGFSHATIEMGAGATVLNSADSVALVQQAARGEVDLRMGRSVGEANPERIRWSEIEKVDLDRVGERNYMDRLGLTAREADVVVRAGVEHKATEIERVFGQSPDRLQALMSERFRVAMPEKAQKSERAGMEM